MTIMAATKWATNAEMIVDVVELGYIKPTDRVIDLTFGRGKWWTKYHHPGEIFGCVQTAKAMDALYDEWGDRVSIRVLPDFRDLRAGSNNYQEQFDVVVFDPPYISCGGRWTTTVPDFHDRYGLTNAPTSPAALHTHNALGLLEAYRICKPGGFVMVKCAPYISSGKYQPGDLWMMNAAIETGLTLHDRLILVGHNRVQPGGRQVKHSRNNYSVLLILKKPAQKRRPRS